MEKRGSATAKAATKVTKKVAKKAPAKATPAKKSTKKGALPSRSPSRAFTEADAKKLMALRERNLDENLAKRWEILQLRQPNFTARRLGYVPFIMEYGWAVVGIPDQGLSYTVGLHYRYGQKELLLAAPHLDAQKQKRLLNGLAKKVAAGARFKAGDSIDVEGQKLALHAYDEPSFERFPSGYFASFEMAFEDREHRTGGTLPVLWMELAGKKATAAAAPKKATKTAPKKVAKTKSKR